METSVASPRSPLRIPIDVVGDMRKKTTEEATKSEYAAISLLSQDERTFSNAFHALPAFPRCAVLTIKLPIARAMYVSGSRSGAVKRAPAVTANRKAASNVKRTKGHSVFKVTLRSSLNCAFRKSMFSSSVKVAVAVRGGPFFRKGMILIPGRIPISVKPGTSVAISVSISP